jgi:Nucleotidyltransferase
MEILTKFGRGRKPPVLLEGLCSAVAPPFMEYLAEENIEVVALYGAGVLVRVPAPVRCAAHKLLIPQELSDRALVKKRKEISVCFSTPSLVQVGTVRPWSTSEKPGLKPAALSVELRNLKATVIRRRSQTRRYWHAACHPSTLLDTGNPQRLNRSTSAARPDGAVAQLGERCNRTAEVDGSIPFGSTI